MDFERSGATNDHCQKHEINKHSRASLMGQKPAVVWMTGLSGSGKSTIANILERLLHGAGKHTINLDGDQIRMGLNCDLGFSDADRVENIRRIAEVSKLMTEGGLIVIVSTISPFGADREMARKLMSDCKFIEVFIDTPIEECIKRDPKGLYARAKTGQIKNFTGLDSPYEVPAAADVHVKTMQAGPVESASLIRRYMEQNGVM
ncbi:adenylyl-sulfate kinase [Rhizobium leguminosarum]|uniref:adenylyl-sulfate kinase n=1 Tax=Rhizobium leguminosarum TaxID=384 RepID=UPI003F504CBA